MKQNIKLKDLLIQAKRYAVTLKPYGIPAFLLLVAGLYTFLVLDIRKLNNAVPDNSAINSQIQAAHIPVIDQSLVNQLKSLQDNSVSVQSLFNTARNNPF